MKLYLEPVHKSVLLAALLLATALGGCASSAPRTFGGKLSQSGVAASDLPNPNVQRLVIHTFLGRAGSGINEDAFHETFAKGLAARGVEVKILDTQAAARAKGITPTESTSRIGTDRTLPGLQLTRVEVGKMIAAVRSDERQFSATHRLILFPTGVLTSSMTAQKSISWDIEDVDGRPLARGTTVYGGTFISDRTLAEQLVQYLHDEGLF